MDEMLTGFFLMLLLMLAHLRGSPVFEPIEQGGLTRKTLWGLAVLLVLLIGGKMLGRRATSPLRIAEFIPLVVALMAYESLKHMHATALTVWLGIQPKDSLMMAADNALFGKTPCLWFAQWGLDKPAFISVMSAFYSFYYVAPIAAMGWFLIAEDIVQLRLIRRGLLIGLYGGYCSYVLIPVAGPLSAPVSVKPLFFEQMTGFQFLMDNFRYAFDCFPSLHTAIPWLLVLLCWNKLPRRLMAVAMICSLGVTVSTVALRFHYGVDVLAGFAWAWTAAMLARLSSPVHSANRRSTAEQNSFWPEEKQIAPSTRIPARGFSCGRSRIDIAYNDSCPIHPRDFRRSQRPHA
jgi:membrane-associated phospholipid phosphatase